MFVNEQGEGVDGPPEPISLSAEAAERLVDMMIIRLRHKRQSIRVIAHIMNRSKSDVERRLKTIPPEVVDYYTKAPWLGF